MTNADPIKLKLVLLGDSGVGKTSLIRRFVEDRFVTNENSTIGYDFKPYQLEVDGRIIQFDIWDTAGAERYSSYLTPSFYRHADGALYVYDVTSHKTFEGITYWVEQTERFTGRNLLQMLDRAVSKQEATDFARFLSSLYVETSAKTSESVQDAFIELVRKIMQDSEFRGCQKVSGVNMSTSNSAQEDVGSGCTC